MFQNKPLIFFHIAKTAGTTLHAILERNFLPETIVSMNYGADPLCVEEFRRLSEQQKAKIKYLHAHMVPFGIHTLLPSSKYIVLLRHPVDRVLSEYYYIRRMSAHPLHKLLVSTNMSLDDFLSSNLVTASVQSGQTRLLSGVKGVDWATGSGKIDRHIFETTKNNLQDEFLLVGLTERFDEFLVLLKRTLGWNSNNILYKKLNVTRKRPQAEDISAKTLTLLEKHNEFDCELYEDAQVNFDQLIASQGSDFKIDLNKFRVMNKAYNYSLKVKPFLRPLKQAASKIKI